VVLLIRFILTMILARFRRRIELLGEARVRFTVLPHDCDLNFHLNSGRYLSFMDVARMDLIGRLRLLQPLLKRGWRPVMGGCVIRFRRSVMPFERFSIRSRVVGWDEKWFYIEHIVENKDGAFCAAGHVRTVIRGKSGTIPTRDVIPLLGREIASPPLPDFVAQWRELEDAR
jgi:acyl-CoA thioesterase FadM